MFPEGFWQGSRVKLMHITSMPVKFKWEWQLAEDLQALSSSEAWISELFYMHGCWPSNCFHRGARWIQMCWEHADEENMHLRGSFHTTTSTSCHLEEFQFCSSKATPDIVSNIMASNVEGGQLLNTPGGKKNNQVAKPIEYEVECEGVQRHCSTKISGTHTDPV